MHTQGSFDIHSQHTESEGYDRSSLELPGMQETFVRLLARLTSTPLIVVLVHGALPGAPKPNPKFKSDPNPNPNPSSNLGPNVRDQRGAPSP